METILPLALSLLAIVISGASLVFALILSPAATVNQRLTNTENDLTELADRVHHWMRRDGVRKARERAPVAADFPQAIPQNPKAALFARARGVLNRGVDRESA